MTIESVVKSISQERISTYKKPHLTDSESESLGLYMWNKRLCSLLLPPLQIIEVSLRNAIYESYIQSQRADGVDEDKIDFLWFKTASANIPESNRHITHAEKQLGREKKDLTPANYIAKLPLGFWVAFCDKKFDVNNQLQNLQLWPTLRGSVFPGAYKGQSPLTIDNIASELRNINSLRNRIAHHETIFNDVRHFHFESAINKVVKSYGRCIKVIKWINPSNIKLIALLENEAKFAEICISQEVARYKALPENLHTTDISYFDTWEASNLVNERVNGEVVVSKANFVLIKVAGIKNPFFCSIKMLPKKRILPTGELVNFVPVAPMVPGKNSMASKLKLGSI
ncbi:Abi family protein [Vibrio splendidus]